MNNLKEKKRLYWNPYFGGFLLGIVLILTFYFTGRGIGATGAAKSTITQIVYSVAPTHVAENAFYAEQFEGSKSPMSNWLVFEIIGVIVGAFISGSIAGRIRFKVEHSPKITSRRRLIFALIGGVLFGFGAQLAKGCTSGGALSGMAVLSLGGYLVMISIFGSAFLFAYFFRKNWI